MISFFHHLFDSSGFPPRWQCGSWSEEHGWLHIISDVAIFGAYTSIPLALAYFIRRRKGGLFTPIFWLFAAFILLCGLSHLIEATIFWQPWYRLSGLIKALTAVVSWITVIALVKALPTALALPGLAKVNRELIQEIADRKKAEAALRVSNERFDLAVKCAQVVLFQQDLDLRYIWHRNPELGFKISEFVGKRDGDLMERPEDAAVTEGLKREVIRTGMGRRQEVLVHIQGVDRYYDLLVEPLRDGDGVIAGVTCAAIDITERKQAEAAVARLAAIVESSHDALFSEDRDGIITSWNPGAERIFGYSADEMVGTSIMRLIPESWQADAHELRERILAGKTNGTFETIRRDKNGREFPASITLSPMKDASGKVIGAARVVRDITERKETEEQVRQREHFLERIMEVTPAVVHVFDLEERRSIFINRSVASVIGYTPEEIQAMGGDVIQKLMHPEDLTSFEDHLQRVHHLTEHECVEFEHRMRDRHGEWHWFASRDVVFARNANGRASQIMGAAVEITAQKKAEKVQQAEEERMRLATEATEVGIWEWNVLTGFIRWDAQMFRLYGVAPTADGFVSYDTWSCCVEPGDLKGQEEVLKDTVQRLGRSTREFRILRADTKECRWIQAVEIVRANSKGEAEWVLGTNLDVTKQKNAERSIRDEARRKDEFLAMLGHELRNPLNAIRHAVQITSESDDQEASRWAAGVIDRQSQQLSRMVDDLLDVARINRGRVDLRPERLELAPVLKCAIAVVQPLFTQRRQTFTCGIATPLQVHGDPVRLEQVFVNLLNNAAKYTPEGGCVSLGSKSEKGEAVTIIADTGVGIPPELLPHVFDLFRQAESALDRASGGLGIGLSVVKSLVEMHSGRVAIESAGANAGTTVTVRLPLLADQNIAIPVSTPPSTEAPPKKVRILIVDDHHDAAHSLAHLLRRRGCEVCLAHSGPDGVTAAREFLPEVLLLDIGLPGYDGYEVVRILRMDRQFPNALFVAISGYAQNGDRERCLSAGFDAHLSKPLIISSLMEVIQSHLGK